MKNKQEKEISLKLWRSVSMILLGLVLILSVFDIRVTPKWVNAATATRASTTKVVAQKSKPLQQTSTKNATSRPAPKQSGGCGV